jgi:hypothetical protein
MSEQTLLNTQEVCLPSWVPKSAGRYLAHTEAGHSIRALAREAGCHASTVLRQVRRYENLRDDVLVDEALRQLGVDHFRDVPGPEQMERCKMIDDINPEAEVPDATTLAREGLRILRRLCETGAVLAVAADMDKGVVVRDSPDGTSTRTAVVDRPIAQAMALKDWIVCKATGRVARYTITSVGRMALNKMLAEAENRASGFAEAQTQFSGQSRKFVETTPDDEDDSRARRVRYNLAESPLTALARRRDRDGSPFLSDDLVAAGERLREDFELAQMGPRTSQNWDRFLSGADRGSPVSDTANTGGSPAARDRVATALRDLGPGLGDAVLRCCCYLEGLETAEKRLGWSARSGKIVLRIALQRLKRYYDLQGEAGKMIG